MIFRGSNLDARWWRGRRAVTLAVLLGLPCCSLPPCGGSLYDNGDIPCRLLVGMADCPDGSADRDVGARDGLPRSCVTGMWQVVGLGRCENDEDCQRWIGTEHVPTNAEPPFPRCLRYPPTGEQFCEGFRQPDRQVVSGECVPGWPCYPLSMPSSPWGVPREAPRYSCVSHTTREPAAGRAGAWITACVGRPAEYVDDRCYP